MSELDPELLAREGNGAIQVDLPLEVPIKAVLAGPIVVWWDPAMHGTELHQRFLEWRDAVRVALVRSGVLVYSPHRAWQGPWHEDVQAVNDEAVRISDVLIVTTPPGIRADGTAGEMAVATAAGVRIVHAPPGDADAIAAMLADVHGIDRDSVDEAAQSG